MTTMHSADEILKQDTRGRVRTPRDQQEKILDEFEASGMSGAAFAAHVGIKYPTFAAWANRRRKQRDPKAERPTGPRSATPAQSWIEVVAAPAGSTRGPLVVHLPGGARMEISDGASAEWAARLLEHLAGARPC